MHLTDGSYQSGAAGEIRVQPGTLSPPNTTLFRVLRSIAISNASRSRGLEAIGVPGLEYGLFCPFELPTLIPDEMEPDREVAEDPEAVLLDALQDVLRDLVEGLDVAGLERRGGGEVAGLRGEDDLVEMDVLLVVVVRRPDHGHALARHVALEHERPDADGVVAEARAEIGELRRRHDPLVDEAEAERDVGCREV